MAALCPRAATAAGEALRERSAASASPPPREDAAPSTRARARLSSRSKGCAGPNRRPEAEFSDLPPRAFSFPVLRGLLAVAELQKTAGRRRRRPREHAACAREPRVLSTLLIVPGSAEPAGERRPRAQDLAARVLLGCALSQQRSLLYPCVVNERCSATQSISLRAQESWLVLPLAPATAADVALREGSATSAPPPVLREALVDSSPGKTFIAFKRLRRSDGPAEGGSHRLAPSPRSMVTVATARSRLPPRRATSARRARGAERQVSVGL